jgi:hypothetical protein
VVGGTPDQVVGLCPSTDQVINTAVMRLEFRAIAAEIVIDAATQLG